MAKGTESRECHDHCTIYTALMIGSLRMMMRRIMRYVHGIFGHKRDIACDNGVSEI